MRIKSIKIENFRCFREEPVVLDSYTTLVGANGSGKSTVLCALNVFFRQKGESTLNLQELGVEDFHNGNTQDPVRITVTFDDLSEEAQKDFADYCRQGELVVRAEAKFDAEKGIGVLLQYGQRKGMEEFAPFFEAVADRKAVPELKKVYAELREGHGLPAATTKQAMIDALHEHERAHEDKCVLIPSEDQFYGFSKGVNKLAKHIQWVYVPAVKDVATEEREAKGGVLGQLLARTVRARTSFQEQVDQIKADASDRYDAMLKKEQEGLANLSTSLGRRFAEWSHPGAALDIRWEQDPSRSVRVEDPSARVTIGEAGFSGSVARMGHGLQRAYLLALLQELSAGDDGHSPALILGIEEPELYQHPPQCRHMASVLQALSKDGSQVLLTTHSPVFVESQMFQGLRLARRDEKGQATVKGVSLDRLKSVLASARGEQPTFVDDGALAKIHQALRPTTNEMFFTRRVVLVEGREDLAYIMTYMELLGRQDDFRKAGWDVVVADGKGKMGIPLAMAKELQIPTFTVFDGDTDVERAETQVKHKKDNRMLLRLSGEVEVSEWPDATFWGKRVVMWKTDISKAVTGEFPAEEWKQVRSEVESSFGRPGGLNKNPLFIARLLKAGWDAGLQSNELKKLCEAILESSASEYTLADTASTSDVGLAAS